MAGAGVGGEGGPGAAGGCGPASPPPPRDYLVPAAAMSPGRNVPPQIMLFISLGGSAAPLHQAPGGHCARSPVLPSSPCAAAPGLGVAAASAPAQVSESLRAARREGAGCLGASAGERGAQGASDATTQWGAWLRVPSVGREGCAAREALAAAAVVTPGRGNPRGFRRRWASRALALGSQLVECRPGARGVTGFGVCVLLAASPRTLAWEQS